MLSYLRDMHGPLRFLEFAERTNQRPAYGLGCLLFLMCLTHVVHPIAGKVEFWTYLALGLVVVVLLPFLTLARLRSLRLSVWWILPLAASWAAYAFALSRSNLPWTLAMCALLASVHLPLILVKKRDSSSSVVS